VINLVNLALTAVSQLILSKRDLLAAPQAEYCVGSRPDVSDTLSVDAWWIPGRNFSHNRITSRSEKISAQSTFRPSCSKRTPMRKEH